jgi:hypothetical protein
MTKAPKPPYIHPRTSSHCGHKRRFHSLRVAAEAVLDYTEQFPQSHGNIRPYLCNYCRWWHIGHRDKEALAPPPPKADEFTEAMQKFGVVKLNKERKK